MRGKTLQTVPFKGISTVLWVHQQLPQSTVSQAFPSNKSYESKAGCNRTPATVLWVPLKNVYHPQDCTGDIHHGFCGGGARIVGFDSVLRNGTERRILDHSFPFFFFPRMQGKPTRKDCETREMGCWVRRQSACYRLENGPKAENMGKAWPKK